MEPVCELDENLRKSITSFASNFFLLIVQGGFILLTQNTKLLTLTSAHLLRNSFEHS